MHSLILMSLMWAGSQPFTLEKIATLAFEDNPANIYSMITDDNGNIYATVLLTPQILTFNSQGGALPSLGVPGQGPGELQFPLALWYDNGFLYTADNARELLYRINPKTRKVEKEWKLKQVYSMQITGNQLLVALEAPSEGRMFASGSLSPSLELNQRFFETPCCLNVKGSKTGGATFDPDGGIWVSYTGEYLIEKYRNGKIVQKISSSPVDFEIPKGEININRYDREAAKRNYASFDKIRGLFRVKNFLLLFRQKTQSNSSLDIYDVTGHAKATIPFNDIVPFQVKDGALLAYQIKKGEVVNIINLKFHDL